MGWRKFLAMFWVRIYDKRHDIQVGYKGLQLLERSASVASILGIHRFLIFNLGSVLTMFYPSLNVATHEDMMT